MASILPSDFFDQFNDTFNFPAHPQPQANASNSHPFEGMHFDSDEDDHPHPEHAEDEYDEDDDQDGDYVDDESLPSIPTTHVTIPPPIPTHSRPLRLAAPKVLPALPVANAAHRGSGGTMSRAIILPSNSGPPKNRPRPIRKVTVPTAPLIASSRPSNVRRAGAPQHRATLSVSSGTFGEGGDPSIPDPNEEGIIMITGAQAMSMTFSDFTANMYLIRKELTDPLYPSFLEPPSKLTPLRCLCCKKIYNGPNARSMWRRHITQKHNFVLGGKKGNGKGKKDFDEDGFLVEMTPEEVTQRRIQQRREWSRGRRVQDKPQDAPAAQQGGMQFQNIDFQHTFPYSVPGSSAPSGPPLVDTSAHADLSIWSGDSSSGELSIGALQELLHGAPSMSMTSGFVQPNQSHAAAQESSDEDDDEPLANRLAPHPIPQSLLAPAPAMDSPRVQRSEAKVVEADEDHDDVKQIDTIHRFHEISSDFDYDLGLGRIASTSPILPRRDSIMPVLSQPRDTNLNSFPEVSASFDHTAMGLPSTGLTPGTPGRGLSAMSEAEKRRLILSLESPTSYPTFARSKTSSVLPQGPTASASTNLIATPGRQFTSMMRSQTMPVLPTLSSSTSSDNSLPMFQQTPGRGLVNFDFFPTPLRAFDHTNLSWSYDSPVQKRKRNHTDESILLGDRGDSVLSSSTINVNGAEPMITSAVDNEFDRWFDMPKTPGKAALSSGTENVGLDGEEGRKAKRARPLV